MPLDYLQGSEEGMCITNTSPSNSGAGDAVTPPLGLLVAVAGAIIL
jgi:hypothetical protein